MRLYAAAYQLFFVSYVVMNLPLTDSSMESQSVVSGNG